MTKFERRMKMILEKQTKTVGVDYQVIPPVVPPMDETIIQRKKRFKDYAKKVNAKLLAMKPGDSYIFLGFGKWIMGQKNNLIRTLKMNEDNLFHTCIDSEGRKQIDSVTEEKQKAEIQKIKKAQPIKPQAIQVPRKKEDDEETKIAKTIKSMNRDFPNRGR